MDDLTAFLKARLEDDEAIATAAQAPSPWKAATHESDTWIVTDATGEPLIYDEGTPSLEEAAHIARHDPARVLREVEAGRRILGECAYWYDKVNASAAEKYPQPDLGARFEVAMPILLLLALPYDDHPDYRPEWKP